MWFFNALLFIAFALLATGIIVLAYALTHPGSSEAERAKRLVENVESEAGQAVQAVKKAL